MVRPVSGWIFFAAMLNIQPAFAQAFSFANDNIHFNSELAADLYLPTAFDGLYAGFELGLSNNNFHTFYNSGTNTYRIPAGAFVGYNSHIRPWLLAGVELQGDIAMDWISGASDFRVTALGRAGFLNARDFAIYQMAGLGIINSRFAYAIGVGAEQAFTPNFAVRGEAVAYGQLGTPAGVTNYGGFTLIKIAAGPVWYFNSTGAPAIESAKTTVATDFTGPYLGSYVGGIVNMPYNFFTPDPLNGWHLSRFAQGGIAGWNYAVADKLRAGVELQAGINYNTSGGLGWDAQVLARLGATPMEGLMVYGSAGTGLLAGRTAYSLGGGVEYALWGKNTLRMDAQMLGEIQPAPPIIAAGFSATKITVGTLSHMD